VVLGARRVLESQRSHAVTLKRLLCKVSVSLRFEYRLLRERIRGMDLPLMGFNSSTTALMAPKPPGPG
jgi:hypothetical protein